MTEIVITKDEMLGWLAHYERDIAPTCPGPEYLLCSCNGAWIVPRFRGEKFRLGQWVHGWDRCYKRRKRPPR